MEGMIKLPADTNLVKFVQKTYEMSSPQGMGFMHAESGGLSERGALRRAWIMSKVALVR